MITRDEYTKLGIGMTFEETEIFLQKFKHKCVEETLKVLPSVINHLIKSAGTMTELSKKFYEENKDLVGHKKEVAQVIERFEELHPDKNFSQMMKEIGPLVREQLKTTVSLSTPTTDKLSLDTLDSGFGAL